MTLLIILILIKIASFVGLYGIFKKAGVEGPWKAFVPIWNVIEWLKIIGKPKWWLAMLFIPGVNIFYGASMLTGLAQSFRHYNFFHHVAAILGSFFYLPFLGFSKDQKYFGPDGINEADAWQPPAKTVTREWIDAAVFAIVAAHLIRVFFIEAFKIPTSSMEPTLQIGDFMFVSKAHYGSRIPNTPLSLPFMHHSLAFSKGKKRAYSEAIKWPYRRLPGLQKVKRNDVVVFNVPFEHDLMSGMGQSYRGNARYYGRPVDKREHYIKHAVGIPGDVLEIKDKQLYINGEKATNPENLQYSYVVDFTDGNIDYDKLRGLGIRAYDNRFGSNPRKTDSRNDSFEIKPTEYVLQMTYAMADKLKSTSGISSVTPYYDLGTYRTSYFPSNAAELGWNVDNYGPVTIPKKGMTIELSRENFDTYKDAIDIYEGNDLDVTKNGHVLINGEDVTSYTFKMDYYWLMGDNRHNSLDSRAWGFVPEDHVVGKPLFVVFSHEGGKNNAGMKWNRVLKKAQDMN